MNQILKEILQIFQEKLDVSGTLAMILLKTLLKLELSSISQPRILYKGILHWKCY